MGAGTSRPRRSSVARAGEGLGRDLFHQVPVFKGRTGTRWNASLPIRGRGQGEGGGRAMWRRRDVASAEGMDLTADGTDDTIRKSWREWRQGWRCPVQATSPATGTSARRLPYPRNPRNPRSLLCWSRLSPRSGLCAPQLSLQASRWGAGARRARRRTQKWAGPGWALARTEYVRSEGGSLGEVCFAAAESRSIAMDWD